MASHSPQRARRPPAHPVTQGSMHNLRETSRSPSLRSRTLKPHSMPIVPTAMQIFNAAQPSSQLQQQPSPTSSINSRRSPPAGVTVQRLLPTPPHPLPNVQDANPDRHVSPPLPPQHSHNVPNPHYPRPMHRGPPPQFLTKFPNVDQENWEMTEELLAEIERADLQHSQAQTNPGNAYPAGYPQNQQNNSSPKDPAVERVRAVERSSPKELDNIQQQQRRQQAARESPKARERQPTSPTAPSFSQPPSQTPEHQAPPYQNPLGTSGEPPSSGYMQYTREPPSTVRRASNPISADARQPIASLATQTPPLQAITTRTPDRSLPVQEEVEDEPGAGSKNGTGTRDAWQDDDVNAQHVRHVGSSPTPSSDLNPDGGYIDDHTGGGRLSRAGHRDENDASAQREEGQHRYSDRDREHLEDEGGYTPRSPTAELPEHPPAGKYYQPQSINTRPVQPQPARRHARNGSTDQLGLRTLDPSVFEGDQAVLVMGSEQLPKYAEPRRQTKPQPQLQPQQYYNAQQYSQAQYHPSQMLADDMQQYDSSYIQSYLQSPRPEAPIPPTPHSQTAAPSPSPLISGNYDGGGKELPPFSPVAPVGSPYPYPFTHVRRNQTFSGHPNRPQVPVTFNANDLSVIQQQMTKQWQVYAQNHHGNITDSTFSPSSTPFQGASYTPWAFLHTNRTLGIQDTTSLRSSPSHEPIALPTPPPMIGVKKSNRPAVLRRHRSGRIPPPRVESTQPRETSPEPSSSGEETAGEERFVAPEGNWVNGTVPPIPVADANDEWIDEEDDDDDLLELEYHPNYVSNVEKRRRRWEIGWEGVTHALQSLDRQTDATIIVMAAPSHSTKLYSATSRSVRRQSGTTSAVAMKEMRGAFGRIAAHRRSTRSHKFSLLDRFLNPSASSGDGSDGSSESREEDLKRALEAALGSLGAVGGIYEQREARWHEEMRRVSEDRERVELLLRQVLGDHHSIASPVVSHSS